MRLNRNTLFLTELVLNVLIFALCAGACVLMLVRADSMRRQSSALTDAVYIAQTAAETFRDGRSSLSFDAAGNLTDGGGDYTARCSRQGEELTVELLDRHGERIYTLQVWGGEGR